LRNRKVLSLEWKNDGVLDDRSGEDGTIQHKQVLRTNLNNSEIRYKKLCIFLTARGGGCVRTLHTLYVYATELD